MMRQRNKHTLAGSEVIFNIKPSFLLMIFMIFCLFGCEYSFNDDTLHVAHSRVCLRFLFCFM